MAVGEKPRPGEAEYVPERSNTTQREHSVDLKGQPFPTKYFEYYSAARAVSRDYLNKKVFLNREQTDLERVTFTLNGEFSAEDIAILERHLAALQALPVMELRVDVQNAVNGILESK